MSDIKVTKEPGNWVVRIGGAVVGESSRVLRLSEGTLADVMYVPRQDLGMEFFDISERSSHCPHKGDATYFHFAAPEGRVPDVAWSYEAPMPEVAQITGHLAFYPDKALLEEL